MDGVVILTIDRPSRRDAIGAQLVERLFEEFDRADRDPATRAMVLAGTPPGFCAGSDLKELAGTDLDGMRTHEARTAALARSIALLDKPVVAGAEGFALGGGFVLAISCDVVVTTPTTRWHLPEVSIGWIPPWGLQALVARVGPVAARRLSLGRGDIRRPGGVSPRPCRLSRCAGRVGSDAALRLARQLAALPAPAVASTKQFFAPLASGQGESLDAWANRLFLRDCGHPAAKATLSRFGVRS